MITGFEVGAVFRLVDEVTGPLGKILKSVRDLNIEIKAAREGMAGFSSAAASGLAGAIAETNNLAAAWVRVEAASLAAARAATGSAAGAAAAARGATAAVGGGGGFRPGIGGAHLTGPGVPLPGGSHLRLSGTPALVGAGALALAGYEAMNMEDAIWWLNFHAGLKHTKENNDRFKKIIEDAMKDTGLPLKDVAEAATQEVRMFQGTRGVDPIGELPKLLRAAAFEAKAKPGTTVQEAMKSLVGMAHMVKAYTPEEINKLLPVFAALSIMNPQSLSQMEKSYSYSVPLLQSGMDVDPTTTMLLGTALATAGVTNTKSGTWVREMVRRSVPGSDKHNEALKKLGLLDDAGKPTWFTNGKPDPMKLLDIAGPKAASMPVEDRIAAEHEVFGTQGSGAFSVLADPKVLERARAMREKVESSGFASQYEDALGSYAGTTKGEARTALQEFNVLMIELGTTVLPAVNGALKDLKHILEGITSLIPSSDDSKWKIGTRAIEGAAIGAGAGLFFGQPALGAAGGAIIGGGLGALEAEQNKRWKGPGSQDWVHPKLMNFLQGPPGNQKQILQPVTLTLNLDGHQMGMAMSEILEDLSLHPTGPPDANGWNHFRAMGNQDTT